METTTEQETIMQRYRNGERKFPDADLRYAHLVNADLRYAYLVGADLRRADLRYAYLSGTNLRSADLRRANLSYAHLFSANLSGANLVGAYLSGAYLSNADLSGANLSGTDLSNADLSDAVGLVDAGMSPTGYRTVAVQSAPWGRGPAKWLVYAGCRRFTPSEALEHWAADATRGDDVSPAEQNAFIRSLIDMLPIDERD